MANDFEFGGFRLGCQEFWGLRVPRPIRVPSLIRLFEGRVWRPHVSVTLLTVKIAVLLKHPTGVAFRNIVSQSSRVSRAAVKGPHE